LNLLAHTSVGSKFETSRDERSLIAEGVLFIKF